MVIRFDFSVMESVVGNFGMMFVILCFVFSLVSVLLMDLCNVFLGDVIIWFQVI